MPVVCSYAWSEPVSGPGSCRSVSSSFASFADKVLTNLLTSRRAGRGSRGGEFGYGGDLALGLVVVVSAFDADEKFLAEDREDALEHWDGGDVVAAFKLGDERVGCAGSFGDLALCEVEFVAAFPDVCGDPVSLP